MVEKERKFRKLWALFSTFFKIAAVTVGGGYAMIPVMEQEFVHRKKWISEEDIVDVIAVVQSLPGIIAANISVFIGYRVAGIAGALAAVLGAVLPSFVVIVIIAACMISLGGKVWLDHLFTGVRAGVCALVLLSVWNMGKKILKGRFEWTAAIIAFVAIVLLKINPILIIVAGALTGWLWCLNPIHRAVQAAAEQPEKQP